VLVNGGKLLHVPRLRSAGGYADRGGAPVQLGAGAAQLLETDQTEAAHIIHTVRLYALACPRVAFSLIEDGRTVFRSPECATLAERVAEIFGRQTAEALVPIECAEPGLRLSGLIGRPGVGRSTRHEMIVFVNARPVDSRTLNYALIESYQESLPRGRYPLAFVFFECDPAAVDVNVHPAKREVRFRSEPQVRGFVIRAVLARLRELGTAAASLVAVPSLPSSSAPSVPLVTPASANQPARGFSGEVAAGVPVRRGRVCSASRSLAGGHGDGRGARQSAGRARCRPERGCASACRRGVGSGLAHGNYALFETAAGLVLLDRRAAHERVWFERLSAQFASGAVPSQRLLLAVPVELDAIASALLLDRSNVPAKSRLRSGRVRPELFRLEALPAWMEPADAEQFLRDLFGAFRDGAMGGRDVDLARERLAQLAAARAVRLPETVNEAEMRALVQSLFATRSPLTSPAGRPDVYRGQPRRTGPPLQQIGALVSDWHKTSSD
jgi:DNA mismatch repair protein MutL